MDLLILPDVSKNIIHKSRKSICVTVCLRTYMFSQHFGDYYTSFTQPEAEIHALELDWNTNVHEMLCLVFVTFSITKNDPLFLDVFLLSFA